MRVSPVHVLLCAALAALARGEPKRGEKMMVVLKSGQFFEGKVEISTTASLHLDTRFGVRVFDQKDIEQKLSLGAETDEATAGFGALGAAEQTILNAQAEYDLGEYEKALSRVEALQDLGKSEALRQQRDWLIIEINERLARWDTAKRLLKEKADQGTPPERIRAKAHLDIFEVNPDHDLRFVGEKHARNFIFDEAARNRARESNALQDHEIMRLALEEYCEQLLRENDLSVKAFTEKLDAQATLEALKKATGKSRLVEDLPYMKDMMNAEASLAKAQAVLGDYGQPYELDIARNELAHLINVSEVLRREVVEVSPETLTPAFDPRTGALTPQGRQQWQARCDEFLKRAKPLTLVYEYMLQRVERFPSALRDFQEILDDLSQRFDEMVKGVKRAREQTHV